MQTAGEGPVLNADERKPAHSDQDQRGPAKKATQYRGHSAKTGAEDSSPARLLCLWDSPGKDTAVGCHVLLQGIFPTQGSNLHGREILYRLSHQHVNRSE